MPNCHTIHHLGTEIVVVDIAGASPEQSMSVMANASKVISARPAKSVLILTDVTETTYSASVLPALKDFAVHNTPFVKASAVIGAEGLRALALAAAAKATGRKIRAFDTRAKALDWLVSVN